MKKLVLLLLLAPSICLASSWEKMPSGLGGVESARTAVPNGWLVQSRDWVVGTITMTFVPDETHAWTFDRK